MIPSAHHPEIPPIVLLVEDDPDTLDLYDTFLTSSGYWVARAASASEACATVDELHPDVVVSDLGLIGRSDGLDVVRFLQGASVKRDVPIILLTGRDAAQLPDEAKTVERVLVKPVLPDELERELRGALERSRELRRRGTSARNRIAELVTRSDRALERSREVTAKVDAFAALHRVCPGCSRPLEWCETRTLDGIVFDYYRPCPGGCGLHCFDRSRRRVVRMV